MHRIDTLIIGGGVAGASVACSLAERGAAAGAAVVDVDLFGKFCSSELNGGGIRCTFAEPINIRLSLASMNYYRAHAEKLDFRQRGYFWMYDGALWDQARRFLPLVRSFGLPVEEIAPQDIHSRFPILDDVSDLAGATFTPLDGRLSPHRLRMHYLDHAQAGGVQLLDRWQVIEIQGEAPPYLVRLQRVKARSVKKVLTDGAAHANAAAGTDIAAGAGTVAGRIAATGGSKSAGDAEDQLTIRAETVVNAAGPWAPEIARHYGRALPVTPLPRQVYLVRHAAIDLEPLPFFLDYPQDIYFRYYEHEKQPCTLVSWSDPAEPSRIDFTNHGRMYYEKNVLPRLARRIASLAEAELIGAWVGHYELSPDKGAIVGAVTGRAGIFNCNGLSAHGVMQSRALGEATAELLINGRWPQELNLDELTEQRFGTRPLSETMYV
jgi:glycine/D-amino acid oxidase-like deaminating enzyme